MKIKIMGSEYQYEEVEQVDKWSRTLGQIDYINQRILVEKGIPDDLKREVLLHEILHGIFDKLGFSDINSDEQKVNSIGSTLYAVLKENNLFFGEKWEKKDV